MADADFAILGSVTVRPAPGASVIDLSDQLRLLLGRLLVHPGGRVSTSELIDALWDGRPGANPRNAVQVAISALRALLGDTGRVRRVVVTDGDAYRLVVEDPFRVDAERFTQLTRRGRDLAQDRPRVAGAMLGEALSTWAGRPFGELADRDWATGHACELESTRDRAEVELNEVRLALGEHAELEGALRRQIALNPQDERRRGQLVQALDGAGRSAEAQIAYRAAYREIGAVGPALRRIGEAVARGVPVGAAPGVARTSDVYGGGRPDEILLCALLEPDRRSRTGPGLGLLSLLVDRHGGRPHPVTAQLLVASYADVDAALATAAAVIADGRLRARIGIHLGGVVQLGERLTGPGPARARQLAAIARPSQVLLTGAARSLVSPDTKLADLGEQRFFDLGPGERVFELAPGPNAGGSPPLPTLGQLPNNLPVQTTRFVGRDDELATISRIVAGGVLITLTGPGGVGKTRLALQVAARQVQAFADGAWFVELAAVPAGADVETVAAVAAHQLGARSLPGEPQFAGLLRHLSDRAALVVIDNCEQAHAACVELVAGLRAGCRDVCLIATTRRALRVDGENELNVASLAVDSDGRGGPPADAVQLFLERAGPLPSDHATGVRTLSIAARICRAVDGLPLAIELAAAQVGARGLDGVATEIEAMMRGEQGLHQFINADPGRPDRQRTIESTIEWSYRLLGEREQRTLRRLAVFRGSFGVVEAQRALKLEDGDAASLQGLLDCSMVAASPSLDGGSRVRLVEPIRAYALNLLTQAGELDAALEAHAGLFVALAVATAPRLFGPEEQACLQRLEADHDNLRAALAWNIEHVRSRDALRLVGALWWLWFSHGHLEDGCKWVALTLAIDGRPSRERVRALRAGSHLSWWRGRHADCDEYNVALDECARAIGDDWGLAWVQMGFGATRVFRDPAEALPLFEESKRRFDAIGRGWEAAYALHLIGGARWFSGDERAAGEAFEEAAAIFDALGHRSVLASVGRCAGLMAARSGSSARGTVLCTNALRLSDAIKDRAGSAQALNFLATISRDEGDPRTAVARHGEALGLAREVGDLWATCWALDGLAGTAREFDEPEIAARLLAQSAALAARSWYVPSPHERELRERDVAALRAELGETDFELAVAEGGTMGVGEAVSCALAFVARHA